MLRIRLRGSRLKWAFYLCDQIRGKGMMRLPSSSHEIETSLLHLEITLVHVHVQVASLLHLTTAQLLMMMQVPLALRRGHAPLNHLSAGLAQRVTRLVRSSFRVNSAVLGSSETAGALSFMISYSGLRFIREKANRIMSEG